MPSVGLCLSVFGATCLRGCIPPLVRHIFVMLVCLIHTFLCFVRCCYACLACFVPPVQLSLLLCIFAHLPTCSCMSLCVARTPLSLNYGHPIQIYICPSKTPPFFFFFYNMLVCPHLASFASLSFSMLSFYLLLFLFVGLFLLLLHVHTWSMDTWSKGVTSLAQAKYGKDASKKTQAHKGQCSIDWGAQPFPFLFLFQPLLKSMYQGSHSP